MRIGILISANGKRSVKQRQASVTGISGIYRTRWHGARPEGYSQYDDYVSLTHVLSGRACNTVPLTIKQSEDLIEAMKYSDIEWEKFFDDPEDIQQYFVAGLSREARDLATGSGTTARRKAATA